MPAYSPIHCRFRAPLPGPFTPLASSCPRTRGVGGASFRMPRIAVRQPAGSLRCLSSGQEREERRRLALSLLGLVKCVERESSVLLELQGYSSEQLLFLFTDRAPTTLKRHLSGWRRWAEYCFGCNVAMGAPACTSVLNFLEALAAGSQSNCGKRRSQAASGVVHALRLVAHKLGLQSFACTLHGPIVGAWLAAGKWDRKPPKEALPVYFRVVQELEEAALCETCEDYWLICSFLLMLWSGLRFSDAQRTWRLMRNLCGDGYAVVGPVRAAFLLAVCLRDVPGASGARAFLPNCYGPARQILSATFSSRMDHALCSIPQRWRSFGDTCPLILPSTARRP